MYLAIRSDNPQAEIYLVDDSGKVLAQKVWVADRTLARDLPGEVDELFGGDYDQLTGIIAYQGPGSFTGLRIGITVANAVAYAQKVPMAAVAGDNWLTDGVAKLAAGDTTEIVLPEYGAAPHITPAKK
ncbi:MAG: hypothetical protein Q4C83_00595 [Candidatus Saccharibacteria bacterium]|nr:hypothetical protein [Candidatus Saccharibacteria bacterium]